MKIKSIAEKACFVVAAIAVAPFILGCLPIWAVIVWACEKTPRTEGGTE